MQSPYSSHSNIIQLVDSIEEEESVGLTSTVKKKGEGNIHGVVSLSKSKSCMDQKGRA